MDDRVYLRVMYRKIPAHRPGKICKLPEHRRTLDGYFLVLFTGRRAPIFVPAKLVYGDASALLFWRMTDPSYGYLGCSDASKLRTPEIMDTLKGASASGLVDAIDHLRSAKGVRFAHRRDKWGDRLKKIKRRESYKDLFELINHFSARTKLPPFMFFLPFGEQDAGEVITAACHYLSALAESGCAIKEGDINATRRKWPFRR